MTEAEWLVCEDPGQQLTHLTSRASERKLRLFAVACCRRAWPFLIDARSQKAVGAIERHADESLPAEEWEAVRRDSRLGFRAAMTPLCKDAQAPRTATCAAAKAVWHATGPNAFEAAGATGYQSANAARRAPGADFISAFAEACFFQAALLRDVFGNPFRPGAFSPDWRTPTAVTLAAQVYESRDFSALPILADALQDAGCDNADVLDHCRNASAPHVRGCWVVDLVLGKE